MSNFWSGFACGRKYVAAHMDECEEGEKLIKYGKAIYHYELRDYISKEFCESCGHGCRNCAIRKILNKMGEIL